MSACNPYSFTLSISLCLQPILEGPSTDQQEAVSRAAAKIRENTRKGSTGETVSFQAMVPLWCPAVVARVWVAVVRCIVHVQ